MPQGGMEVALPRERPNTAGSLGDVIMLLGQWYLSKSPTPLAAYNRLQIVLMRRFLRRGGTMDAWMQEIAPAFRRRYGWICESTSGYHVHKKIS